VIATDMTINFIEPRSNHGALLFSLLAAVSKSKCLFSTKKKKNTSASKHLSFEFAKAPLYRASGLTHSFEIIKLTRYHRIRWYMTLLL